MLQRYLPILSWLPGYSRADLTNDAIAAAVVTIMLIPQGMAYAMLAGLPPQAGYTARSCHCCYMRCLAHRGPWRLARWPWWR